MAWTTAEERTGLHLLTMMTAIRGKYICDLVFCSFVLIFRAENVEALRGWMTEGLSDANSVFFSLSHVCMPANVSLSIVL